MELDKQKLIKKRNFIVIYEHSQIVILKYYYQKMYGCFSSQTFVAKMLFLKDLKKKAVVNIGKYKAAGGLLFLRFRCYTGTTP